MNIQRLEAQVRRSWRERRVHGREVNHARSPILRKAVPLGACRDSLMFSGVYSRHTMRLCQRQRQGRQAEGINVLYLIGLCIGKTYADQKLYFTNDLEVRISIPRCECVDLDLLIITTLHLTATPSSR